MSAAPETVEAVAMRAALQRIANLPHDNASPTLLRAKRIALAALGAPQGVVAKFTVIKGGQS